MHHQPIAGQFGKTAVPSRAGHLRAICDRHCDNRLVSVVTMGLFATGVAMFVLLIASHDRPFTGRISVSTEPLLQVIPEDAVPVRV
jgi:hypothetical protein